MGVLGLQSCGKKTEKITDAVSQVTNTTNATTNTDSDFLSNAEKLQKAEDELKNLPKFKGKELRAFQNVNFYGGISPRIEIEIIDPDKPQNVDHYTYRNGKWEEPQPVQISGSGDMSANSTPLKDIKFTTVATVFKNWNEKAKTVEGADKEPLDFIYFRLWVPNQDRYWDAQSINGTREKYYISFNLDGSVKEFKKQ